VGLLAACGRGDAPRSSEAPQSPPTPAALAPADSLVLTAPTGIEVWATFAREGKDSAGGTCTERGLEVRQDGQRRPVPLLYTRDTLALVNDTTIRARLWTNCRPGDAYLVNLRNGLPVRKLK
jgi:hypothetical protein